MSSHRNDAELYSGAAELYHQFRPTYMDSAVARAVTLGRLTGEQNLLEIGCGPGTATSKFAGHCRHMHCIDPSSGMLSVAKRECSQYSNLSFEHTSFEDYQPQTQFQAVLAATSLHWPLKSAGAIQKLQSVLKPKGALILLWNLPFEPPEPLRSAVAEALNVTKPYFFGGMSFAQHKASLQESVLAPIEASGAFTPFTTDRFSFSKEFTVDGYLAFLQTLSPCIRLGHHQREEYLSSVQHSLASKGAGFVAESECIVNVGYRL